MECKCKLKDVLRIPRGNEFKIGICRGYVAPGNEDGVTFADIDGLAATIVHDFGMRYPMPHEVLSEGDLLIDVVPNLPARTYGIELVGSYGGHSWRWKAKRGFRIVDSNCEASMQGNETFDVETYWLGDILEVDTDGDAMIFTTHGHATIEGGILTVQETANTKADLDGDTIIFTTKSI